MYYDFQSPIFVNTSMIHRVHLAVMVLGIGEVGRQVQRLDAILCSSTEGIGFTEWSFISICVGRGCGAMVQNPTNRVLI